MIPVSRERCYWCLNEIVPAGIEMVRLMWFVFFFDLKDKVPGCSSNPEATDLTQTRFLLLLYRRLLRQVEANCPVSFGLRFWLHCPKHPVSCLQRRRKCEWKQTTLRSWKTSIT